MILDILGDPDVVSGVRKKGSKSFQDLPLFLILLIPPGSPKMDYRVTFM